MSVVHSRAFSWAFSLNKQSALSTGVTPSQINKMLPQRGFAPFVFTPDATVSDAMWYGKGRSFPSFWEIVSNRLVIPAREFSMSQLSALFAPAFVLGKLTTVQPNTSVSPTVYQHTLTFQDPLSNQNCLSTSFIEHAGGEYQKLISGAVIDSFNIKAAEKDHVVMGWQGFARKAATDATSMPSLATGQSFFKLLNARIDFGAAGAASNFSTSILDLNLTVTQNAQPWWLPGAASGDESLLSKVLIGDQQVSGDMTIFLDNTTRNLFLNQSECEITITFVGGVIPAQSTYRYQVQAVIKHFKISAESFADQQQTVAYKLTFDKSSVLKNVNDEFFSWIVQTDTDASELLVNA